MEENTVTGRIRIEQIQAEDFESYWIKQNGANDYGSILKDSLHTSIHDWPTRLNEIEASLMSLNKLFWEINNTISVNPNKSIILITHVDQGEPIKIFYSNEPALEYFKELIENIYISEYIRSNTVQIHDIVYDKSKEHLFLNYLRKEFLPAKISEYNTDLIDEFPWEIEYKIEFDLEEHISREELESASELIEEDINHLNRLFHSLKDEDFSVFDFDGRSLELSDYLTLGDDYDEIEVSPLDDEYENKITQYAKQQLIKNIERDPSLHFIITDLNFNISEHASFRIIPHRNEKKLILN